MIELSIILPMFNAESYLEESLKELSDFLKRYYKHFEIIAVDDGSTDATPSILSLQGMKELRCIRLEQNHGKGFAVAQGMKAANGICRIFTDADLPYDLRAIPFCVNLINDHGYHLVVGDRTLPGSDYFAHIGKYRTFASRLFAAIVRLGIAGDMFDTQCGFKAFRGDIAQELFSMVTLRGFSFDAEVLYIALKYNMAIRRIPVRYKPSSSTTVRPFFDGIKMLVSILQPPKNWRLGIYKSEKLERICHNYYWEDLD
jgi:dolichyl-phosphate beta-glucosyltransferase